MPTGFVACCRRPSHFSHFRTLRLVPADMNMMKNFKRRFSLSVPRTETIEESLAEFTEQFNQLHNRRNEGEGSGVPQPRVPQEPLLALPDHTFTACPEGRDRGGGVCCLPSPRGETGSGADASRSQTCSLVLLAETPGWSPAPSPPRTAGRSPGSRPLACSTGGRASAASPWR